MIKMKEQYVRKCLFGCKLTLVLLLLFMFARMLYIAGADRLIFAPSSVSADEPVADVTQQQPVRTLEDYKAIISNNVFGVSDTASAATLADYHQSISGPIDEQLGITLIGTLAGSPAVSRAIIKDTKTNRVTLYKIGDTVADATIETIEKECVGLLDHGLRKTLCLRAETQNAGPQANKSAVKGTTNPGLITEQTVISTVTPATDQPRNNDIDSVLAKAVIEPHRVNDKVDGLKISGIDNEPLVKALGFLEGDVIQIVNGQQVTNKQQAFQILKKAKSQDSVGIELLRNNKTKSLFFPLRTSSGQ
jgi:type II secretion system protein C